MPNRPGPSLQIDELPGAFVILAGGEIDLANADALPDAASRIDGAAPRSAVLLDLSRVEFMDSSGLRGLLEARRRIGEAGHPFALLRPSAPVRRVLELVDLLDDIPVVDSAEPAELARLA